LLDIKGLTVEVDGREILHDINLTIGTGETHALFGPNGMAVGKPPYLWQ